MGKRGRVVEDGRIRRGFPLCHAGSTGRDTLPDPVTRELVQGLLLETGSTRRKRLLQDPAGHRHPHPTTYRA